MTPINHPLCNTTLGRPSGTTPEECGDLPIYRADDGVVSFWRPEPAELELMNQGSPICLLVQAPTHPPVYLSVAEPAPVEKPAAVVKDATSDPKPTPIPYTPTRAMRIAQEEFTAIAAAITGKWDDPNDFKGWAQSRAAYALARIAELERYSYIKPELAEAEEPDTLANRALEAGTYLAVRLTAEKRKIVWEYSDGTGPPSFREGSTEGVPGETRVTADRCRELVEVGMKTNEERLNLLGMVAALKNSTRYRQGFDAGYVAGERETLAKRKPAGKTTEDFARLLPIEDKGHGHELEAREDAGPQGKRAVHEHCGECGKPRRRPGAVCAHCPNDGKGSFHTNHTPPAP